MYRVEVKISFRAGHRLCFPYEGKCNNVHGEYFTAIFILEKNDLNKDGMVMDFGVVKKELKFWIDTYLDHAYIHNEDDEVGGYLFTKGFRTYCIGKRNPTAENLAELLYNMSRETFDFPVIKVGVVESTETSIAWFIPKG